jgi:glycosyltransferase 2 family protein
VKRVLIVAAALIVGVFVWLAVRTIDLELTWQALRESDAVWVVPSVALVALSVPLRALRWWAVFSPSRRPPLGVTTKAVLIGLFFNNILPFRAGEAARLVYLARRAGVSRAETLATVVVERVFDVLALVLILFVSVPFLPEVTWFRTAVWLALALGVGLGLAVGVLLVFGDRALRVLLWPLRWLPFMSLERWECAPRNLGSGLAALRSVQAAGAGAVLTILSWLVLAASTWALMPAFDLDLGFEAGALVLVVGLAMVVPSPPAALGVFEGAVVVALVRSTWTRPSRSPTRSSFTP